MKTKQKSNKHLRLFNKYSKINKISQKKDHLTETQIKKLMKVEFKLVYNAHVFNSFMAIWSTKIDGKQVITKNTFINKLFRGPDGFFRDITL
jgi:hypothetical protein